MTIIKTQIDGQDFEITVADGLHVEFSEGKLHVSKPAPYNGLLCNDQYQRALSGQGQSLPSNGTIWVNPTQTFY